MTSPLEVAAYQLGIRFRQVLRLHSICWNGEYPDHRIAAPDDIVRLEGTFQALIAAWGEVCRLAEACSVIGDAVTGLIEHSREFWRRWSRLLSMVDENDNDDTVFRENFARIETYAIDLLGSTHAHSGHAVTWFRLGNAISDGYSTPPRPRIGRGSSEIAPDATDWWADWKEVESLILQLNLTPAILLPSVAEAANSINTFPHIPLADPIWIQVEAGLKQLVAALPRGEQVAIGPGVSLQPIVPPEQPSTAIGTASSVDTNKQCRIRVDVESRIVYLDAQPIAVPDRESALFVQALVTANGDWIGPKELSKHDALLAELRPGRLRKKLDDRIANLVEISPAKGSRIPSANLRRNQAEEGRK